MKHIIHIFREDTRGWRRHRCLYRRLLAAHTQRSLDEPPPSCLGALNRRVEPNLIVSITCEAAAGRRGNNIGWLGQTLFYGFWHLQIA